jgi:hypothetical protein
VNSPEERAETMRAQIRAWTEENRPTLSAEQLAVLEENIAFITPELYQQTRDPALVQRRDDLIARTQKLFYFDQLMQAFFRNGPNSPTFVSTPMELTDIPLAERVDLHVPMAFDGLAYARVQYFVDDQLLREEEVSVLCQLGLPKDPPVAVRKDVFAGVTGERGRIVVTPVTEGARIWATAHVVA